MASRKRIWIRRTVAVGVVAVVGAGVAVAVIPGDKQVALSEYGGLDYSHGAGGAPTLRGDIQDDGARGRTWRACSPKCGPVLSRSETFEPGPTTVGTRFRLAAPDGEIEWERFTPEWKGQLRSPRKPQLSGVARVGTRLVPRPGKWLGGWPDDRSGVGIRACRTRTSTDCVAMTPSIVSPGDTESVTIKPSYVGWYVGAVDVRFEANRAFPAVLYDPAPDPDEAEPAPNPGVAVAVGPLIGPVTN